MAKEPAATKAIAVTTRSFLKASPQSLHPAIRVFVAIATRYNPEELACCEPLFLPHALVPASVCGQQSMCPGIPGRGGRHDGRTARRLGSIRASAAASGCDDSRRRRSFQGDVAPPRSTPHVLHRELSEFPGRGRGGNQGSGRGLSSTVSKVQAGPDWRRRRAMRY